MDIQNYIDTRILFSIRIETYLNEYNRSDYHKMVSDIDTLFKENIDQFFIERFTEDDLYYFWKMYKFETTKEGIVFYVGIWNTEEEVKKISEEIFLNNNIKDVSLSIYDSGISKIIGEDYEEISK